MRQSRHPALAVALVAAFSLGCADKATGPKATALEIVTPPSTSAQTTVALASQPSVRLVDASGAPVEQADVVITADVTSANGRVVAGGTATTDATGVATFQTLTLGALNGAVGPTLTLSFSSPSLTPVTAPVDVECFVAPIQLAEAVSSRLTTGDCRRPSGTYYKEYLLDVSASTKAIILSSTADFQSAVVVRGPNEPTRFMGASALQTDVTIKQLVPPGLYHILETTPATGITGNFTLAVTSTVEDDPQCELPQFHSPLATDQVLRAGCLDSNDDVTDLYLFILSPGSSISASVTTTAFTPLVAVWRYQTNIRETFQTDNGNTVSVSHTNALGTPTFYFLQVSSSNGTETGAYTVSATITNPAGPAPAIAFRLPAPIASLDTYGPARKAPRPIGW